mmetsp:Transcript_2808/g.8496  ORF Transcript_2808/g.8496 Transcript_2808/m.8496 type:complete len:128 (+) Transcript_2808:1015-1398(+)
MIRAMAPTADMLNMAPNALGQEKDVAQRVPQRDWTPWMQFAPQSYSGNPIRETFPLGDMRAVSRGGFSSSLNREIKSLTRSARGREVLQKGNPEVSGVEHARGIVICASAQLAANRASKTASGGDIG